MIPPTNLASQAQLSDDAEQAKQPYLKVKTIDAIEPLDDQFGVDAPKTVPDVLFEPLFGGVDPTEADLAAADGDPAKVPPMQTYAILDAAKITNLVELLGASGLEHRCLFKGAAEDELKNVAPWIVRLEDDNRFTRNLFTRSDAPWHLWDKKPGIYLRSRGSLDQMWSHFRKFTRVQGRKDEWYYFRFWEPLVFQAYMEVEIEEAKFQCPMFHVNLRVAVWTFICCPSQDATTIYSSDEKNAPAEVVTGPKLTSVHEKAIVRATERRRRWDIVRSLRESFSDETKAFDDKQLFEMVGDVARRMASFGIRAIRHIHTFSAWQLVYGKGFEMRDPQGDLHEILGARHSEEQKISRFGDRLNVLHELNQL